MRQAALCAEWNRRAGANSLAGGHGGLNGVAWALIPLLGMLLTIHYISNPKVASHLQVKPAICAGVALRMTEGAVRDAHCLCPVELNREVNMSDI